MRAAVIIICLFASPALGLMESCPQGYWPVEDTLEQGQSCYNVSQFMAVRTIIALYCTEFHYS